MITASSPFWRAGFRPFFTTGALYALTVLSLWILILAGVIDYETHIAPSLIHGHEMIYGFSVAAIAGFILTAMPNWTNTEPLSGKPLITLFGLWLLGRLSLWAGTSLPYSLLATADLLFLPVLSIYTARILIRTGNKRNLMLPGIFIILAIFNLCFYLAEAGIAPHSSRTILEAAISLLLLLITIIGGRIVPAFTKNALTAKGTRVDVGAPGKLSILCIVGTAIMVIGDLFIADSWPQLFAYFCAILAGLHLARLYFWKGWMTLSDPLLWAMHVAYLWIPAGLALKAYGFVTYGYFWEGALHALTAGAIGTMILVVTMRASLGHTGNVLKTNSYLTIALCALTLSAIARVAQSFIESAFSEQLLYLSSLFWILAFSLYLLNFLPLMNRPRLDGKPG
ncbi:NnrS family protein [Kiloniella sp. EL199]|uniref:NnrS family protein n=1 Tax=Kiloniella sp. EL199 TaxID=2107581 RepID=UPI000EA279AC|nr:NnrS family protein [Kiloniella sp. EL199]